jgi:hypothetical protein
MTMFYSCSTYPRISAKQEGINPVFEPYVESYRILIGEDSHEDRFENLNINFSKLEGSVIGRCWWLANGGYEIEIDSTWWYLSMFNQHEREFVMYHELEHCIRYRLHTDRVRKIHNFTSFLDEIGYYIGFVEKKEYLKDGCPASLMHSTTLSDECRHKHYRYYMEEIIEWDN